MARSQRPLRPDYYFLSCFGHLVFLQLKGSVQKLEKVKKDKTKIKKGYNDEGMDAVVSQQVIADPSSHEDGDVLTGGYETYFITC